MNAVPPPNLKSGNRRAPGYSDEGTHRHDASNLSETVTTEEILPPLMDMDAGPSPEAAAPSDARAHAGPFVPPQLASIEVTLSVEVGSRMIPLRDLLSLEPGQLFALDRMTSEPVTVLVNGKPFAKGEVVAIGERFGVRLLDMLPGSLG